MKELSKVHISGSSNYGNFVELFNFSSHEGDTNLKHLASATWNVMHTSLEVQNQFIKCCQEFILEKIAAVFKINKFYSIAADEATDFDMKEKLALIL